MVYNRKATVLYNIKQKSHCAVWFIAIFITWFLTLVAYMVIIYLMFQTILHALLVVSVVTQEFVSQTLRNVTV